MFGSLPATVDPILLADSGTRLTGRVALQGMTRLRALLLDDLGEADIDLVFERSKSSGRRRMRGRIVVAAVNTTCQRCLEPMHIRLEAEPDAILLREEELPTGLASEADALIAGQTPMALTELVEDELLLVMPMVPMHALHECPAQRYIAESAGNETAEHPLAGLVRSKRDPD